METVPPNFEDQDNIWRVHVGVMPEGIAADNAYISNLAKELCLQDIPVAHVQTWLSDRPGGSLTRFSLCTSEDELAFDTIRVVHTAHRALGSNIGRILNARSILFSTYRDRSDRMLNHTLLSNDFTVIARQALRHWTSLDADFAKLVAYS